MATDVLYVGAIYFLFIGGLVLLAALIPDKWTDKLMEFSEKMDKKITHGLGDHVSETDWEQSE